MSKGVLTIPVPAFLGKWLFKDAVNETSERALTHGKAKSSKSFLSGFISVDVTAEVEDDSKA